MHVLARLIFLGLLFPATALAQIGLLIPSGDMLRQGDAPALALRLGLFDPLARQVSEGAAPKRLGVQHLGEETDLLAALKPAGANGPRARIAEFAAQRPGDYTFYVENAPRWDAGDEQFVVPLAKVCVNVAVLEEGWDEPVGLEAEIVPLSRPYGLWTGNLFSGQVLLNGEPAPYVAIEVAWLGDAPEAPAAVAQPAAAYRVQKLRADASGVFHYAMPKAGWWVFAATLDADWTLPRAGDDKPVAIVTSYWVQTRDMQP